MRATTRLLVAAVVVLLLGGVAWMALGGAGRESEAEAGSAAGPSSKASRADVELVDAAPARGDVTSEPERVAAPVDAAETEPPADEPTPSPAAPDEVLVEGDVVVVDPAGVEHPHESGRITLVLWKGTSGRHRDVDVEGGVWSTLVPPDVRIGFDDVLLGERRAVVDAPTERVDPNLGERVRVVARWPKVSTLRVRSAETGADLAQVAIARAGDWLSDDMAHPGASAGKPIGSGLTSPIDLAALLPEESGTEPLYAHAPGFAWGRIEIDFDAGGQRILDLGPGGGLRVAVAGEAPKDAMLRLHAVGDGTRPWLEHPFARELELTGIAPGAYRITCELGEWFRKTVELGSADGEVVAGGLTLVSLAVAPPPTVEKTRVHGTLVVHPDWGDVSPTLVLETIGTPPDGRRVREYLPSGKLARTAGVPNTWTFDFGEQPTGRYELGIDPPVHVVARDVTLATGGLRIEVPAPGIAAVRVIDENGVELDEVQRLHWRPKWPQGVTGGSLESVERDPATGRFEIRAPLGAILVDATGIEFQGHEEFEVRYGRREVDLALTRRPRFVLIVRAEGVDLPWDDAWDGMEIRGADDESHVNGWSTDSRGRCFAVTRPGVYRFTPPRVDGYLPAGEQVVVVPADTTEPLVQVVDLVRAP